MWEDLEIGIKLNDKCNVNKVKTPVFMGQGKKENPEVMVIFDHPTDIMYNQKNIIGTDDYEVLKNIFDYVKINMNDCYFTTLTKYYNKDIIKDSERKACMSFLLEEIFLLNPKNIVCVGEETFNYLYKYFIKENKNEDKIIIDIKKNMGNIFNFYDICLIPIVDMKKIKDLNSTLKKKIVESLKERNK